ncbi:hypothetical protein [Anaerotignum sp.]|uniref:hypothetical protein n=1 Tax=Anaerotignum sp. TaxID=2039241 RepID=UPI00271513C2|nr:hypothetical protein [Anaerotignum sp.]
MILFWGLIMFLGYLIDKYLIRPRLGRKIPDTFIDWLKEGFDNERRQAKELLENIRESFQKSK